MKRGLKYIKRIGIAALLSLIVITGVVLLSNVYINKFSEKYIYSDINEIPYNRTGLLLGTSKYLTNGNINLYFRNRIRAAYKLYSAGKIDYIIVSGDNAAANYNEPRQMKKELISLGVPATRIYEDYAGFRTLDAIIRAREIFSQFTYTVISQEFHNKRAVFIARKNGIRAIGYNASGVSAYYGFKTNVRELFARVKVFIDFLIGKQPKFLGNKIYIRDKSLQERLDKYKYDWEKRVSPETVFNFNTGIAEITLSGILSQCLRAGDTIPEFTMTGIFGNPFDIKAQLNNSYVLLFWYRGSWCPYSEIQMHAYQEYFSDFEKNGIKIFALCPEKSNYLQNFNLRNNFGYKLIRDKNNKIARLFGIEYKMPEIMAKEYEGIIDIKDINGIDNFRLPVTATYLINSDGVIIYSHIDPDYRNRTEPAIILSMVKGR